MRLVWKHPTTFRQRGHGGDRDRTDDPLLAKQVLSQLSYAPKSQRTWALSEWLTPYANTALQRLRVASRLSLPPGDFSFAKGKGKMGQGGLEPPTPRLSSVCSNQLSYWPHALNTPRGVAPKAGTR